MHRTPVSSSSLASVGFSAETKTLEVEFHGGAVYQYFDVPAAIADGFWTAPSLGRYFQACIRGRYRYRRV